MKVFRGEGFADVYKQALYEVNNLLARCCVPECIYRGWCYENTTCDYHRNIKYRKELNDYEFAPADLFIIEKLLEK